MTGLIGFLLAVAVIASAAIAFLRADAATLARGLRLAGPVAAGLAGLVLMMLGRVAIGLPLLIAGSGWFMRNRYRTPRPMPTPGGRRRSTVRTAALEMELDHETGGLEGMVLAGRYEQRVLGSMALSELLELRDEIFADGESRQLIETYLDGRFPVWREHANANDRERERVSPGAGAMSKQEAYKVLGLEAGASAADVRKAHRRLMQRLHPDAGGTSFLAARINEAKDILLSDHE